MGRKAENSVAYLVVGVLVLLAIDGVQSRGLEEKKSRGSNGLVSDGISSGQYLVLNGIRMDPSSSSCEEMYGFLPCSSSIWGHLFLIMLYEYLLFHGEIYLAAGGEQVFRILGPGVFGASAVHVLGVLPEAILLLASGLLHGKEVAEEFVFTGVGLLAGSSILLLTVLWGTCIILAGQNLHHHPNQNSRFHKFLHFFTDFGVHTDKKTRYSAMIMAVSILPFLSIQLLNFFPSSYSGRQIILLFALSISSLLLLVYFIYQIFKPWIQKRKLEFVKTEHLMLGILKLVEEQTQGRILTEDGAPDVNAIKRLFDEIDVDGDETLSHSELTKLIHKVEFPTGQVDKKSAVAKVMNEFDVNGDNKITREEFVHGFIRWTKLFFHNLKLNQSHHKSLQDVYHQSLQPLIKNKKREREIMGNLIEGILKHFESNAIGRFLKEDGNPDEDSIQRLFERIDRDGNNYISKDELQQVIEDIKFGDIPLNPDEIVAKLNQELDTNEDSNISREEFTREFSRLISTSTQQTPPRDNDEDQSRDDDDYQKTWEKTDEILVNEENSNKRERDYEKSILKWLKAIGSMVFGVAILAVLAEPLIFSVQDFSKAANLPTFFVSFMLLPLATNARFATSAITAAYRKKSRTTSLAFSEIYSGVFMNNILGFCLFVSLIYFRGLRWEFSGEVLVVAIVCAAMGVIASFCSTFPRWTAFLAFLLYPSSLVLVYILTYVVNYV